MLALPYITVPALDLTALGLGRVSIFSLLIGVAVIVQIWIHHRFTQRGGEIRPRLAQGLYIVMILGAYIGSTLGQILLYHPELVAKNPWVLLKIWRGGYSSIGGYAGTLLFGWVVARIMGVSFLPYLDRAWFAFCFGWVFGRTGCSLIHDHPGLPTDFFLGVAFPDGVRHDLGLYELLFQVLVILPVGFWITRRPWRTGQLAGWLMLLYAIGRFLMDFLRAYDPRHGGLTPAQWGMITMLALALWLLRSSQTHAQALQPPLWGKARCELPRKATDT